MSKGKLFVISGASGVGKSTVLKAVMEARKDLSFSVSATTRAPRPGEVDGVSYYFISREMFFIVFYACFISKIISRDIISK